MAIFGGLLVLASAFVRVRMPGGLAVAIGAMLALQALEVPYGRASRRGAGATGGPRRACVLSCRMRRRG